MHLQRLQDAIALFCVNGRRVDLYSAEHVDEIAVERFYNANVNKARDS